MDTSLIKLDGRTVRGRLLKDLQSCGKPLKQGALISKKVCSKCNESPDQKEIIECMRCHDPFHITCLLNPISETFLDLVSTDPSVWWFCLGCMSAKSNAHPSFSVDLSQENNLTTDLVLTSTLMNFKQDMLKLVAETIDAKLKVLPSPVPTNKVNKSAVDSNAIQPSAKFSGKPNNAVSFAQILSENEQSQRSTVNSGLQDQANKGHGHDEKQKHVLLLEPKDVENVKSSEGKKISMQNINNAFSDVNVEFCSFKKSGLVAVGFSDSDSKKLAEEKLKDNPEVSAMFSTRLPRKLLPKVTIRGINECLFDSCYENREEMKKTLLNDIIKRNFTVKNVLNANSNEIIEVVMLQKVMPSHNSVSYMAVLKMSSNIRKAISDNGDKLYISLKRCKVVDRFHIRQCYHCQKPGHMSGECPAKAKGDQPTCFYCSGNHMSAECRSKKLEVDQCCSNCLKSKNLAIVQGARMHTAADLKCPVLQSHINSIKQKTENWQEKKHKPINCAALKIMVFNARSLGNKTFGICEFLKAEHCDVCFITEAWIKLKDESTIAEIKDMGYNIKLQPRKGSKRGGGICVIFKPELNVEKCCIQSKYKSFEVLHTTIKSSTNLLRVSTFYRTGKMSVAERERFANELDSYLESLLRLPGENILCGDLNIHVEDLSDLDTLALYSVTQSYGYTQLINAPTQISGGTLDLVFVQNTGSLHQLIKQSMYIYDIFYSMTSDHNFIEFLIPFIEDPIKPRKDWLSFRNYKSIDIEKFGTDLKSFLEMPTLDFFNTNVEQAVDLLNDAFTETLDKHAPTITKYFSFKRTSFTSSKLLSLRRERRKFERRYRKYKNPDGKKMYEKLVNEVRKCVKSTRNEYYCEDLSKANRQKTKL